MTTLINLTPHPMHLFAPDVPNEFAPGTVWPIRAIEPSGQVARVAGDELGTFHLDGIPVENIDYRAVVGLPEYAGHMDSRDRETWYLVSLPVALAAQRDDLLVPYLHVRNPRGSVIGCRMFARATASPLPTPSTTA